jgi:hypothetical protein
MIKFEMSSVYAVTARYNNDKKVLCSDVFYIRVERDNAIFLEAKMYFKKRYLGCALLSMTFKKV